MPSEAQPTDPQNLPQAVLALSGVKTAVQMRAVLTILGPLVEACEDEDFDRFMARSIKAMLRGERVFHPAIGGGDDDGQW